MMEKNSRIYVAGHNGLVGRAIVRRLQARGHNNIVTVDRSILDLTIQQSVDAFFEINQPEYVFLAAAKVGGIHANNTYPADFINNNLQVQCNVINACHKFKAKKLVFLGTVCIYPKFAPEPVKENSLLTGELEPTNQWYAIAKIAGIKMCQAFRRQYGDDYVSVMPCNLYGVNDNFHPENSHVLPALMRKFHLAKLNNEPTVTCWGTGNARREFMYVDDTADAVIHVMNNYSAEEPINIGVGGDFSIKEAAELMAVVVGYKGEIVWDTTKSDGTPRRRLDISKLTALGWRPTITLSEGLKRTYDWYSQRAMADGTPICP